MVSSAVYSLLVFLSSCCCCLVQYVLYSGYIKSTIPGFNKIWLIFGIVVNGVLAFTWSKMPLNYLYLVGKS